jgi:hypothetical protein
MRVNVLALVLAAQVALVGCGDDSASVAGGPSFDEIYDQGLSKYAGAFRPANDPTPTEGAIKTFRFAVPDDLDAEPRGV